jgi:glycosyltransferase involved in cell wall biosynthesis
MDSLVGYTLSITHWDMGDKMTPKPLMIYSDNPALHTGLARITRHLAAVLASMPEFRVGTYGRGGVASRLLPWAQYVYPETAEWGQAYLPQVWKDFACGERGIIMTIMDPYRVHWFSRPQYIAGGPIKEFLEGGGFERWGYFPIDHIAPNGLLSAIDMDAVRGYDRLLGYSIFGAEVLSKIVGHEVTWIPHGIDTTRFHPMGREGLRFAAKIPRDTLMVGMVATNQSRKYWGLAASIIRELKDRGHRVCWWAHIDDPTRYWNIHLLLRDFAIENDCIVTVGDSMGDEELAAQYSMCDVTMLPTGGEGFGYSIAESMACGTPCVTVDHAAGRELTDWLVKPREMRVEEPANALRPVTNPSDWCDKIEEVVALRPSAEQCVRLVEFLNWMVLGQVWRKWLREGLHD